MNDAADIPCVSVVEPLFLELSDRPVCTRTWEAGSDPELSHGDVVDIGGTACRVTGKANVTKGGARFVTYQFSPYEPFA